MAATCRACGKPYTRRRVVAVSGQLALTLIITHSLFCFARQEAKTLVATFKASQMDTLTRFGSELLTFRLLCFLNLKEGLEFAALTKKNVSTWRRCSAWHGQLPGPRWRKWRVTLVVGCRGC